ncbi:MAG TPA: efflux RND transporter permease subunit [Thermoanaerobaculia bacterium]|nr:efflux RND transporter permease subunit [Thermoanaerobaculia bacterium]
MTFAGMAERQGRAIVLITLLLAGAGALVLPTLSSDIYPPLQFARLVVIAHSGSLPARAMMTSVTRPLEQAAMEVPGIRRVRSRTFRGSTEISAQFDPATDMAGALQNLQNRVAEARSDLPAETELTVERLTVSAFPMLSLNVTGGLPIPDLYDYSFLVIRPALARVPGVGRIEVAASDTREIEVVADPGRLLASGLTVGDVVAALRAANRLAPVGRYAAAGLEHLVLASGLWSSAGEIARTPVAVRNGATIRVADVAQVFPGSPDRTALVTGNGHDAAVVSVSQQPGASILGVKAGIEATLNDLAHSLPSGLRLSKVYDLAEFVATAIANVRDAILIGGALAVIVLLLFLRDWRVTLIAAIILPLTVLATFLFMRLFGESINLMSMGGLAVAIGLVIDDAVVMVENIHRRLRAGRGERAIAEATEELIAPVVGSTLTTVVVLAPLGFLSGVVGQFFRALSLTLSVSVLISLALSLTLIPLLSHFAFPSGGQGEHAREERPSWWERGYARALDASVHRPWAAVAAAVVLAVFGYLLYRGMPSGFLPPMDEGGFVVDYLTPPGTALAETDAKVRKVEAILAATPEVAAFSRRTGAELGLFATQPNKGDILVRLKARSQRTRSAEEVIAALRPKIAEAVPGLDTEFAQLLQDMLGDLEGTAEPLEVKIFGDDSRTLADLADSVQHEMEGVKGVVDLVGPQQGSPETTWRIDPEAAGRAGLTVEAVQTQLAAAWAGETATDLRLGDRGIPVRVRYPDAYRFDPTNLTRLSLRTQDGRALPLASVAQPVVATGDGELTRENLRQVALVTGRLENRDLGSAAAEIQSRLRRLKLPVGYTTEVGGQYESQRQAFRELLLVFGAAAALVLLVLVIEFRALTPALILLLAAPLSFGGSFLLLRLAGSELDVSSSMGLILLVGLVVKNGIVMLDYAHRLRAEGSPFVDAVAQAARVRLRPILMTTLCTLFGLLPLALGLGAGAELQKPLALAVVGGLGLSTLVTLFAVPSAYVALRRRGSGDAPRGVSTILGSEA